MSVTEDLAVEASTAEYVRALDRGLAVIRAFDADHPRPARQQCGARGPPDAAGRAGDQDPRAHRRSSPK